jgi:Mn2+/Fe2+ NRAMP family transporter
LTQEYDELLSGVAFKFNWRRYIKFCGSDLIMGNMVINKHTLRATWVLTVAIILANMVLIVQTISSSGRAVLVDAVLNPG